MDRKNNKKKRKKIIKFNFKTTHELADILLSLAEYLKSLPNIKIYDNEIFEKKIIKASKTNEDIPIKPEMSDDEIKSILSKKTKKELERIARKFNISSTQAKNLRKSELINEIINTLRAGEKFDRLRKFK